MYEYLADYQSALAGGQRDALEALLERARAAPAEAFPLSGDQIPGILQGPSGAGAAAPTLVVDGDPTRPGVFNRLLARLAADLGGLYAESRSFWRALGASERLGREDLARLRLAVQDLESRVRQAEDARGAGAAFTDTAVETFGPQARVESDARFYENGTLPRAFVDFDDGILRLSAEGELAAGVRGAGGATPAEIFLDRLLGAPVTADHLPREAFDGELLTYWAETLHAPGPLYATAGQCPWLPGSYAGGAACRLRVEFERATRVSEFDLRPYGAHPLRALSYAYTTGTEADNLLPDPGFRGGLSDAPAAGWWVDAAAFGEAGTGTAAVLPGAGPAGENVLVLAVLSPTGSVSVAHGSFPMETGVGTVEVGLTLRTAGPAPIALAVTALDGDGQTLSDKIELITVQSLAWTEVLFTADCPAGTRALRVRVGIPPTFAAGQTLWAGRPRVEALRETLLGQDVIDRQLVFLDASVMARRLYLTFAQEHYSFRHYRLAPEALDLAAARARLDRRPHVARGVLSYDRVSARERAQASPRGPGGALGGPLAELLRPVAGGAYARYAALAAAPDPATDDREVPAYEYVLGAYEIALRHREYAGRGRYVSPPIRLGGEIREIRLRAADAVPGDSRIDYGLTVHADDAPEGRVPLTNCTRTQGPAATSGALPPAPGLLAYGPGSGDWAGTATFTPDHTYTDFVPLGYGPVLAIQHGPASPAGDAAVHALPAPVDLRGAQTLNFVGIFWNNAAQPGRLALGISGDGALWDEQIVTLQGFDHWPTDRDGNFYLPRVSADLSGVDPARRAAVTHLRWRTLAPNADGIDHYLLFGRVEALGGPANGTLVRFLPAGESVAATATAGDRVVAPLHRRERARGTDRRGRVPLGEYPYTNRETVVTLTDLFSRYTGGVTVPYDPNALDPKYVDEAGDVVRAPGYRPVAVTLTFDDGRVALPDALGAPTPGEILAVVGEKLLEQDGALTTSVARAGPDAPGTAVSDLISKRQTQQTRVVPVVTYVTAFKNLVIGAHGTAIQVYYWGSSGGRAPSHQYVDPAQLLVDPGAGALQIFANAVPSGATLYADYYYRAGESSAREVFEAAGVIAPGDPAPLGRGVAQRYPVTRNRTDYVFGATPPLARANLDPLDPAYYPVYEYRVAPEGDLVFADDLHPYGDTPAWVDVEYDTLAIAPRLLIDLTRGGLTADTPRVDEYQLLANVRRES